MMSEIYESYEFNIIDNEQGKFKFMVSCDNARVSISRGAHFHEFDLGSQEHLNLMTGFEKITTILRESMYRYNARQLQCRDAMIERKDDQD